MEECLLVIENSCATPSLALWKGDRLLGCESWTAERNHASAIFEPLQRMLEVSGGIRFDEIVVGSGPGSYGGVRVALAVADGLSLIRGGRVVSFCSWNGLGLPEGEALVLSDARRGGLVWGRMHDSLLIDQPEVLEREASLERLRDCLAQGIPLYSTESSETWNKWEGAAGMKTVRPRAEFLGQAWMKLSAEEKEKIRSQTPSPLYVRPPHITAAKRPAWAVL